ncbi:MAG: hypothetical protein AAF922_03980 [Pseudomonadota bacterium]
MSDFDLLLERVARELKLVSEYLGKIELVSASNIESRNEVLEDDAVVIMQGFDLAIQSLECLIIFFINVKNNSSESGEIDFERATSLLDLNDMKTRLSGGVVSSREDTSVHVF